MTTQRIRVQYAGRFLICLGLVLPLVITRPVDAQSTDRAAGVIMTTVRISDDIEALFVLDTDNRRLTGQVINNQTNLFAQSYARDISGDFKVPTDQAPRFAMVTGRVNLAPYRNFVPNRTVLYVTEVNTGRVVAYAFSYKPANQNVRGQQLFVVDSFQYR